MYRSVYMLVAGTARSGHPLTGPIVMLAAGGIVNKKRVNMNVP